MVGAPRRTPTGWLGSGELRRQVAGFLAATPGSHTAGGIARAIGARSVGAVGNAVQTLAASGHATQSGTRPRRYRATGSTAQAARSTRVTGAPAVGHASTAAASSTPVRPGAPEAGSTAAATSVESDSTAGPRTKSARPDATSTSTAGPTVLTAAGPTGGARAELDSAGVVRRPNGQRYHPRVLADLPDVAALRRLREANIPALLYGPPGTGKTSLVEAAFPDLITVAGDGDTAVADFVGEYAQAEGGGYEFIYGPLVVAMREGRTLLIDDATLISPKVLAVVYPALDGRRQIIVKAHKGETITAADGFYVVAGHNPGVHGAVLTDALSSRFAAQIQVSTDYDLARALRIEPKAIRLARHLATRQRNGDIGWAPQLRELIAFQKIADVLGPEAAVANLVGVAPEEDRDLVTAAAQSVYGRVITPLALGRQL
jgi:nitric oxide reductase NorQ protein